MISVVCIFCIFDKYLWFQKGTCLCVKSPSFLSLTHCWSWLLSYSHFIAHLWFVHLKLYDIAWIAPLSQDNPILYMRIWVTAIYAIKPFYCRGCYLLYICNSRNRYRESDQMHPLAYCIATLHPCINLLYLYSDNGVLHSSPHTKPIYKHRGCNSSSFIHTARITNKHMHTHTHTPTPTRMQAMRSASWMNALFVAAFIEIVHSSGFFHYIKIMK